MTITESAVTASPPTDAATASDFHLVESPDGWVLTIRMSRRIAEALADLRPAGAAIPVSGFTVHVEPNLLPGEPFATNVVFTDRVD